MNLGKIYEGWRNHLLPPVKLKKLIKLTSEQRMKICDECEYNSKYHRTLRPDVHCIDCGCTLSAKTKCLSCSCELKHPKWVAVITEEEENVINERLK